jgi:dipeptide transport system permease protein
LLRFLLRRVTLIVPTFICVTLASFLLIHSEPGDPIEVRVGEHGIAPERLAMLRHEFGIDQPQW